MDGDGHIRIDPKTKDPIETSNQRIPICSNGAPFEAGTSLHVCSVNRKQTGVGGNQYECVCAVGNNGEMGDPGHLGRACKINCKAPPPPEPEPEPEPANSWSNDDEMDIRRALKTDDDSSAEATGSSAAQVEADLEAMAMYKKINKLERCRMGGERGLRKRVRSYGSGLATDDPERVSRAKLLKDNL